MTAIPIEDVIFTPDTPLARHFYTVVAAILNGEASDRQVSGPHLNVDDANVTSTWLSVELEDRMAFKHALKGIDNMFVSVYRPSLEQKYHVLVKEAEQDMDEEDDASIVEDKSGKLD